MYTAIHIIYNQILLHGVNVDELHDLISCYQQEFHRRLCLASMCIVQNRAKPENLTKINAANASINVKKNWKSNSFVIAGETKANILA